jgi:hypothetical protein
MYILCQILSLHFEEDFGFNERGGGEKNFFSANRENIIRERVLL